MEVQQNKASDKINGFYIDDHTYSLASKKKDDKQEFSFFNFALGVAKSPVPLNFSYGQHLDQSQKRLSNRRGLGRRQQFVFLKELVASNSVSKEWEVNKTPKEQEEIAEASEDEDIEEFPMIDLKNYLSQCEPKTQEKKTKKKGFTRANVDFPYYANSVTEVTPRSRNNIQDVTVSVPLKPTHQPSAAINQSKAMASSINSNVPAPGAGSESAPSPAFIIPMTTTESFYHNGQLLKDAKIVAELASISHKYVSVNVLEEEQFAFKQFCIDQNLTILNSYPLRIFVPIPLDKVQFLVTRKGRAPQPPTAVEHCSTTQAVVEVEIPIKEVSTPLVEVPFVKVVKKRKSKQKGPTVSHLSQYAKQKQTAPNGPRASHVSQRAARPLPYNGKVDHTILDQWAKLSPEQVLIARETHLQAGTKHKEEVLQSTVDKTKSFASCLEGINKVITTFTYLQVEKKESSTKLKGIPHKVWNVIGKDETKIRAYYKQMFRSTFYTLRARWVKLQTVGEDMNPYTTDFNYFWRQVNTPDMSKIYDNIRTWEKKVIAFCPKASANSEWYKSLHHD